MATYYHEDTFLYHNGEFVRAAEAKIDLYSQSLHYGYGVFEGIRAYKTISGETRIFEAVRHYDRLKESARAINMPYVYDSEDLVKITYELLEKNKLQNAYIRPLVYAPANMGFNRNSESYLSIAVWEMAPFLGNKLLRVMTSSYQRPNPRGFHIEAKATGHYVNSLLASQEAKGAGYDEALLTDMHGFVAEGPGANLFFEKDGALYTPPRGNILPGITRATVIDICERIHIPVIEKLFTVEEMKKADAAFFCGTAAEIIGWESLDDIPFQKRWHDSLSRRIQKAYADQVAGAEKSIALV